MKILHQDDPVTIQDIPDDSRASSIEMRESLLEDGGSAVVQQE
jgi:hypothetical protein